MRAIVNNLLGAVIPKKKKNMFVMFNHKIITGPSGDFSLVLYSGLIKLFII